MPKLNEIQYRHAKYYVNRLNSINRSYRSGLHNEHGLADFDSDQRQIEHGYKWACGARIANPDAAELCAMYPVVGGDVLMLRQDAETFLLWNITGLEIAENENDTAQIAGFLVNLGWSAFQRMEYDAAERYFRQALERASEADLRAMSVNPYSGLASVATERGLFEEAIQFYHQALDIWRRRGDIRGEYGEYGNISIIHARLQNIEHAHEYAQQAFIGLLGVGDLWRASAHLNNLGIIYAEMERPLLAVGCFVYSMRLSRSIRNQQEFGTPRQRANRTGTFR